MPRVLRARCKEEISIFKSKIAMDLIFLLYIFEKRKRDEFKSVEMYCENYHVIIDLS